MARPARVRIRSRKPCVRARRRLFGWKVRLPLLTVDSPGRRHGSRPAAGLLNVLWTERVVRDGARRYAHKDTTVGGHGSHLIGDLALSNALVVVPEDVTAVAAGEQVQVLRLDEEF